MAKLPIFVCFILFFGESLKSSVHGACQVRSPKKNFKPSSFSGLWYETESAGDFARLLVMRCPTHTFTTSGNDLKLTSSQINIWFNKKVQFDFELKNDFDGVYTMYSKDGPPMRWMVILDTDYKNWALIWTCHDQDNFSGQESIFILTRSKNPSGSNYDGPNNPISEAIYNTGIVPRSNFARTNQTNC